MCFFEITANGLLQPRLKKELQDNNSRRTVEATGCRLSLCPTGSHVCVSRGDNDFKGSEQQVNWTDDYFPFSPAIVNS